MKRSITALLFISLFNTSLNAQMKDKFWVMAGFERIHGTYSGISNQVMDDRFKMANIATFRYEAMGPRKGNFFFDWTGLSLWTAAIGGNRYLSSTYTENGFHRFENHYIMRLNSFRIRGNEASRGLRFGWGYQLDWRKFGAEKNEDNNGQSSFGSPGLSYGPLELKGRFSGGFNMNLVSQTRNLYSRYSLNFAYSPGKIQGVSVSPEATWYLSYKRVALFVNAAYRVDYIFGNRMTTDFENIPDKTNSLVKATHLQLGIALDIWKWGKG